MILYLPRNSSKNGSAASERRPLLPRANFLGVSVMTIGSRYRINEKQVVYQSFDEEVVALMLTSAPTTACGAPSSGRGSPSAKLSPKLTLGIRLRLQANVSPSSTSLRKAGW